MRPAVVALALWSSSIFCAVPPNVLVVVPDERGLEMVKDIDSIFEPTLRSSLAADTLERHAASGGSFIWIGAPQQLPPALWMGTFRPTETRLRITPAKGTPVNFENAAFQPARVWSGFLQPTKELPYHNVVEEPRADLIPLLEARDRFGTMVGYPGVLLRHYAPSLAASRFDGSEQFYFFLEDPWAALSASNWRSILKAIALHLEAGVQVTQVKAEWASYKLGEKIRVEASVANRRPKAVAVAIHFLVKEPGDKNFRLITDHRRTPSAAGTTRAAAQFTPRRTGLYQIRVEVLQDRGAAETLSQVGKPSIVDQEETGVLVHDGDLRVGPTVSTAGINITIDGSEAFWIGTHYYPSTSWWDGTWRDFRPLIVDRDFAAMRRAGYRLVRIWVDPTFDQESLRAMDAAVLLAAKHGVVLDVCIFTQWGPRIAFEKDDGELVSVELRNGSDFNVYGISFRYINQQKQYVAKLAQRWKNARNIIFNLANETYVRDPDEQQVDAEVRRWPEASLPRSPDRDLKLFRRWAREITGAIRGTGAMQPVIPGYLFSTMGGGDGYLGNREGDISVWHSYMSPEDTAATVSYVDPECSDRPLLLEEFGRGKWNSVEHYDQVIHYALAAGASAAMSYEWGVSWMSPELPPHATFLNFPWPDNPDPRWFAALKTVAKDWPTASPGFFPAASGFPYGSIYHGTPFPAEAATAIGRLAGAGTLLARKPSRASTVIRIPKADRYDAMPELFPFLKLLWKQHARYRVLQSDCAAPRGATQISAEALKEVKTDRVPVSPESLQLLVRETRAGTLYSFFGDASTTIGSIRLGADEITFGLQQHAMILGAASGLVLAEVSGTLATNENRIFTTQTGRILVASADGMPLHKSSKLHVRASEPTRAIFSRPIRSVHALVGLNRHAVAVENPVGNTLDIDTELVRYDVQVQF